MSFTSTQDERHPRKKAFHNGCRGQLLPDRVPVSNHSNEMCARQLVQMTRSVKNARRRSSRLARLCSLSACAGDEHARNQVHRMMERASRVLRENRTQN